MFHKFTFETVSEKVKLLTFGSLLKCARATMQARGRSEQTATTGKAGDGTDGDDGNDDDGGDGCDGGDVVDDDKSDGGDDAAEGTRPLVLICNVTNESIR